MASTLSCLVIWLPSTEQVFRVVIHFSLSCGLMFAAASLTDREIEGNAFKHLEMVVGISEDFGRIVSS